MARASAIQQSFNGGEFSPLLSARDDFSKYKNGCKVLKNNVPTVQGPYTRRPGFYFTREVKDSSKETRLIPFEFSTEQAYIIEVGDQYMRFYKDNGIILSGASPYEISTPYDEADLFDLRFTQSADILFITHPDYQPRELSRTGHTSWTLSTTTFEDGPYLDRNATSTTLTPSGTTGSITLTASATDGINGGDGFKSTDVGRLVRFKDSANNWTWLQITAFTSTIVVTANVEGADLATATASSDWRLGVWSPTTGYPAVVTFYEDRLCYAGATSYPQRVDMSRTGDYRNFTPTDADGTVVDDHAVAVTLSSNTINRVRWLLDHEKALVAGTTGGEWIISANSLNEVLTPTNVKANRPSSYGSSSAAPVRAGRVLLFNQRSQRKIRELSYSIDVDGFKAPDMTLLAEHVTESGVKEMTYQQEPNSIMWVVRNDGVLAGFTYSRDEDVTGWHRHVLGGYSDSGDTTAAKVESAAVIPAASGEYDELWVIVNRHIDGGAKRYVEYLKPYWQDTMDQEDAFFVDSGLTYDGAATDTLSGLDHLEGETVSILADGAVHPDQVVASGGITLSYEASVVHVGLAYNSDYQSLSFEYGAADGTAQGKPKRIDGVSLRLRNTLGIKYGPDADNLKELPFRKASDDLGTAVPLFSGDKDLDWPGGYESDAHIFIRQDQPLPGTILSATVQLRAYDGG